MLHDVTFIDESGARVTLSIECDPKLFGGSPAQSLSGDSRGVPFA